MNPRPAPSAPRWQILAPAGTVVPTASLKDTVKRGNLMAVQGAYLVRPYLALNATLGWTRTRDLATAGAPKLDVFTYDAGAEVRAPRWKSARNLTLSPFAGAGAGARSYNYRDLRVDATHNASAYASAGAELGFHRVALRVEVRDYVTAFKPLTGGGPSRAQNDVVIMTGVRFTRR